MIFMNVEDLPFEQRLLIAVSTFARENNGEYMIAEIDHAVRVLSICLGFRNGESFGQFDIEMPFDGDKPGNTIRKETPHLLETIWKDL